MTEEQPQSESEAPAVEPEPEDQRAQLPPARCTTCGMLVERDKLEPRVPDDAMYHRVKTSKHDLVGNLCGPVWTRHFYQVIVTARYFVPLPVEMEHPGAITQVEKLIAGGLRPAAATVTDWKLVGNS